MQMVNKVLCGVFDDERYITAVSLIINRHTNQIQWSVAGHPPPLLLRRNHPPVFLEGEGFVMGVFTDVAYAQQTMKLEKGDKIVLFSDGLLERDESALWTSFMKDVLKNSVSLAKLPYKELPLALYDAMEQACCTPHDDVTILVTEV